MRVACFCLFFMLLPFAASARTIGHGKWAVAVYMSAKNDLECNALANLAQMAIIGSTPQVGVWVELGRKTPPGCSSSSWSGVHRFHVNERTAAARGIPVAASHSDMGKGESVADFLHWVMKESNADHYMLILWGHGFGFTLRPHLTMADNPALLDRWAILPKLVPNGFQVYGDDANQDSYLRVRELENSLKAELRGRKLDIIAFDVCLMGTIENAYAFRDVADFMVASEDVTPTAGWDYTALLQQFAKGGDAGAHATRTVDSFGLTHQQDCRSVLTAVDLRKGGAVGGNISRLAAELKNQLGNAAFVDELRAIREQLKSYGGYGNEANSVDSRLFVDRLLQSGWLSPRARTEAQSLAELLGLNEFLVAQHSPNKSELKGGLSLYFPKTPAEWNSFPLPDESYDPDDCKRKEKSGSGNHEIEFVCSEKWSDFLKAFLLASKRP
jgi:hypothetical protein